ncbi:hypothetical protein [Streptomyces avicenniae]|uniref:hypothetical protein n=1 Tax=Streptomyces avicenniae TaxID=500153 RepID=UPI00069C3151|nr:hypothetical protein [Streptomyces avicenniae]
MKLTKWASDCESGPCPTLWGTDGPDVIVQGFVVDAPEALATMRLPENETAVRIPLALLRKAARDHLS